MRHVLLMLCLVIAAPLVTHADDKRSNLDGVWRDRYDDDKIEIRDKRYGLEVKKKGLFRQKRIFTEVDYNRYADRDGNVIEILSNNRIVWKNRRNRSYVIFYKNGSYNYGNNRNGNYNRNDQRRYDNRRRNDNRYNNNRYNNNRYNDDRSRRQNQGRFDGRWRCADDRRNIFIEARGDGFRVRKADSDRWYVYNRDPYESNVYRGNNGKKYIYKDDSLIWYGRKACDSLRFGRY